MRRIHTKSQNFMSPLYLLLNTPHNSYYTKHEDYYVEHIQYKDYEQIDSHNVVDCTFVDHSYCNHHNYDEFVGCIGSIGVDLVLVVVVVGCIRVGFGVGFGVGWWVV
jgi:hypothetical protein